MTDNEKTPVLEITGTYIELCKLLKLENWVGGGGEAKHVISEGYVLLNGNVETRKRKKIFDGDIVEFQNYSVCIHAKDIENEKS